MRRLGRKRRQPPSVLPDHAATRLVLRAVAMVAGVANRLWPARPFTPGKFRVSRLGSLMSNIAQNRSSSPTLLAKHFCARDDAQGNIQPIPRALARRLRPHGNRNATLSVEISHMIPAPSFDHIDKILNEEAFELEHGTARGLPLTTNTVGFIVFDQNYRHSPIQDLIDNFDMLNLHSGPEMHFFLCGVSKYGMNEPGARELGEINKIRLYHNAQATHSFIRAFEREIPGWSYNIGFDLILIDVKETDHRRGLDFSSAVYFKVEELIKLKIVERPSELLGKLVKFTRERRVTSAVQFRNELRKTYETNWLMGFILAMFPKHVGKLARAEAVLFGGAATPD